MRKYKKVDASATQNRASAKSGQDTGASTDTLAEKGEVVKDVLYLMYYAESGLYDTPRH